MQSCSPNLRPLAFLAPLLAVLFVLDRPPAVASPSLPPGMRLVTSVEGVTEYGLENGLRVLLVQDPSVPNVTVNVVYRVGSLHENYGESGMAHLLEHLMFKGSKRHPRIHEEITLHGGAANGTTWFDRTTYYETFPAEDENLDWALRMEADRMVASFISQKDLDTEMTVVRNEFEAGENNPHRILQERAMEVGYLWHHYKNPTIGARSDIENVPIERLRAFYRTWYQPDNALLVVAGNFDPPRTLARIRETFGAIPRPARVLPKTYTVEPVQDGERAVILRRVGDIKIVLAMYHVPAGSDPEFAAVDLATHALGRTPSGRLYQALVESRKATSITTDTWQLRDPGMAMFMATLPRDGSVEAARDALLTTVESVASHPLDSGEVERARAQMLKTIELNLGSSERVGLELAEWEAIGDWRLLFLYRDRLRQVTLAEAQAAVTRYFKPSNRTVALFIPTPRPDRAEIPPRPDVAAMVRGYRGQAAVVAGEAFDPAPARIEKQVQRTVTAGGVGMAILPRKTRGRLVQAEVRLHMGDERSLEGRDAAGSLVAAMLMRGTIRHTRTEIRDELDRLKARVRMFGGATASGAFIETTEENLPAVMALVGEILRQPSFPALEFEALKRERLTWLESRRHDPHACALTAMRRHMAPFPPTDVRYTPTLDEELAALRAVTLEDVRAFHRDFYGVQRAEVAMVGACEPERMREQVATLFDGWKAPREYVRVPWRLAPIQPVRVAIETADRPNAVFVGSLLLDARDDDPDYPALELASYVLGGGFLNSRLATRVRQGEGLSYGIGSHCSVHPLERYGQLVISAICAPQNMARLETCVREELARAVRDGFTEEEVTRARTGFLQRRRVARGDGERLCGDLRSQLFLGRTMAWTEAEEAAIARLDAARVTAALRKHVDPTRLCVFTAGDFKGAKKK